MNLTGKQVLLILSAVLSALVSASAQLTDIFGAETAKVIISTVSLANTMLTSIIAVLIGQANLVKDVRSMPGVAKVLVNEEANSTLAKIATDPAEPKVGAVDAGTRMVLQDKAKGN